MQDKAEDKLATYIPLLEKAMTGLKSRSTQVISFEELLKNDREKIYNMAALLLPFSILQPEDLLNVLLKDDTRKYVSSRDTLVKQVTDILTMRIGGLLDSGQVVLAADLTTSMIKVIEDDFLKGGCKSELHKEILARASDFMIGLMDVGLSEFE
ncbi:hypothetical protein [Pedobacter frigoris]|uniref:Uncharacterized protein n=1 Tax=Pedobacter frigoris TaxID=2571272 RepID=A0A4U1CM87_9SPHI|nr:hypothetical protein [Pedobacter frigoris]TKC07636.1 hypothetical protein FA047_10395 [Pedobacter frigoris]